MELIDRAALGVGRCSKDVLPAAYCAGWNGLLNIVNNAPTIDAVPVVRCRECIYYKICDEWKNGKRMLCEIHHHSYLDHDGDNHFCSWGQRKIETVLPKSDAKDESLEETHANTQKTHDDAIENARVHLEEDNMDKPRICEVLGVEVGERFELGNTGIILLVNDDGLLHIGLSHGNHKETDMNVNYLVKAINDPDRIIRKPRFTQQEVEDAKVLARALLADGFERDKMGDIFSTSKTAIRTLLDSRMFPSIQPGQSYTLDEIIGGAE